MALHQGAVGCLQCVIVVFPDHTHFLQWIRYDVYTIFGHIYLAISHSPFQYYHRYEGSLISLWNSGFNSQIRRWFQHYFSIKSSFTSMHLAHFSFKLSVFEIKVVCLVPIPSLCSSLELIIILKSLFMQVGLQILK